MAERALDDDQILSIVSNELNNSERYDDWQTALSTYLGRPNGKEVEGRSQVVSTDVADAIEWIRPQIMESITGSKEIVSFDPLGPQDEMQAQLETELTFDTIMKDNNGFTLIHDVVFDALLQKFGLFQVYYEKNREPTVQAFSGLTPEMVNVAIAETQGQLLEYQQGEDGLYSIRVALQPSGGRVRIESCPPEQFRYNGDLNSADLSEARFTARIVTKTISELVEDGYDPEVLAEIGDTIGLDPSHYRMRAQGESLSEHHPTDDVSQRVIEVAQCFMRMDLNGDGIGERVKITVVGGTNPTHILDIEEVSEYPWVSAVAILMPHKFQGLSIYDRLKQLQDIKTALLRNTLDNISYQNNQRLTVVEGQANLDDVLVSRPGGVIRVKNVNAVTPLVTPLVGQAAFTMLQYIDEVRAGRVGVSPEGNATPQKIGGNVGSEGVQNLLTAAQALVGLITRVIAETAIKPLCLRVRDLLVRHVDAVQDVQFRGQWVQTNPAKWPHRSRTTVSVGLGSGDNTRRFQTLQGVLQLQGNIQQMPGQALVDPVKVYSTLDDYCKFGGLTGASRYFMDPSSPEGQQAAQNAAQSMQQQSQQQMQQAMAELQFQQKLADAEMQKAQAQGANVQLKAQIEDLKHQLDAAKAAAETAGKDADREIAREKIILDTAIKLTQIEAQAKSDQDANFAQNAELAEGEGAGENETTEAAA
jgi:hypothetical protein